MSLSGKYRKWKILETLDFQNNKIWAAFKKCQVYITFTIVSHVILPIIWKGTILDIHQNLTTSVVDPDPNPDVFGPPGSGYRSSSPSRNSKKNLDSYCFVTSFDGNDGNVPSKSSKQKKTFF
jgi:hypothetical protein